MSGLDSRWSRKLCKVLRHCAPAYGLHMSSDGYVAVDALLSHAAFRGLTLTQLKRIVDQNDKSRFVLSTSPVTGALLIRAAQGHSIQIQDDLLLQRVICIDQFPKTTVHATTRKKWDQIRKSGGLCVMKRNHIHLTSYPECLEDGSPFRIRSIADILVVVDTHMAFDDGVPFFWSTNNVLLTPGAPSRPGWLPMQYLINVITRTGESIGLSSGLLVDPCPVP